MNDELVLRTVHKLFVGCSFQVRNIGRPGRAASDNCNYHATNAVVDPETGFRLYRCEQHRGQLDGGGTGETVTAVYLRRGE